LSSHNWTTTQLAELSEREELVLVLERSDRPVLRVPVWLVTAGDHAYVRSYMGVTTGWYRSVMAKRDQAIELPGGDVPVFFESVNATDEVNAQINAAYLAKYATTEYRDAMVTPHAIEATLRVVPR
jgi:hypothetical protein